MTRGHKYELHHMAVIIMTTILLEVEIAIATTNICLPFHCHACRVVTRKRTNKSAKLEIIYGFSPHAHEHLKGLLSKFTVLKVDLSQDHQMYCLQACMCAFFSSEFLQAEAVKGLKRERRRRRLQRGRRRRPR